jgi:hypothetical protein
MSHAQFAEMITSAGQGSGVPCTLTRYWADGQYQEIDGIEPLESKHEIMKQEVRDMAKRTLSGISEQADKLEALLEKGSVPKTELREILRQLRIQTSNGPANMAFVVDQAQETIATAASAAKIEVEAFTENHLRRLGMDSVQQLLGNAATSDTDGETP